MNLKIASEDLYRFQLISGCEISPDGAQVVFSLHQVDKQTEKKFSNLWIAPIEGGIPWQLTHGNFRDRAPQWSPDGKQIAFFSNREGGTQIWRLPFEDGVVRSVEIRQVTNLQGRFDSFHWSPDGTRFVCVFRKKDAALIEREVDPIKKELGIVVRRITRVRYKKDGEGFLPQEKKHIWVIDAQCGDAFQLTGGDYYEEGEPDWSPNGRSIVFVSNRSPDPDFTPEGHDLFVIPADTPVDESDWYKLNLPSGYKSLPVYSPDGRWIAYLARESTPDSWDSWRNTDLWITLSDGSGTARNLTGDHDVHVGNGSLNDLGGLGTQPPCWLPDSQRIFFQITRRGDTTLHAVTVTDADIAIRPVVTVPGAVSAFSLIQERLAYFHTNPTSPGQLYAQNFTDNEPQQLTYFNEDWINKIELGALEEIWFKGGDGNEIQSWILTPPGFDPTQQYPSILQIHGGPLMQYAKVFMHEFYFLAAQGYVVYFCNPRGGRGYGEAHAKATLNNMGGPEYNDLMAWVELVAQKPFIDPQRMGVTGGSYGGYMTNFIVARTQRFKAAVTQRCISNRISDYGAKDTNWQRKFVFDRKDPWDDVMAYWRQSPLNEVKGVQTPTLIIHSEQDMMCAYDQAEQFFVALKVLGVDTELISFPEENHNLSRSGRTDRRVARLHHILRWFDKYL